MFLEMSWDAKLKIPGRWLRWDSWKWSFHKKWSFTQTPANFRSFKDTGIYICIYTKPTLGYVDLSGKIQNPRRGDHSASYFAVISSMSVYHMFALWPYGFV